MSELDQLYHEFYAQVITRLKLEFELFQKEKPYLNKKEQVKRFKNLLGKTDLSTKDFPELVPKEIPGAVKETTILWLVSYFRSERNQYNHDPIFYFFQENEKRLSETFPTIKSIDNLKEILTKFFAQKEALANFKKEISIDHQDINKPLTIMSTKQTLRQWFAAGETERVVEALQSIAERYGDQYYQRDVTHQAGRFNSVKNQYKNGLISDDFYNREINKIRVALQDLIDKVPTNATLDIPDTPEEQAAPLSAEATSPQHDNTNAQTPIPNQPLSPTKYMWISGIGFLCAVGLFMAATYFSNQMNGSQSDRAYYILLFPLAFAAAAFFFGAMRTYATWTGTVLNGTLELGGPIVVAAGIIIGGFLLPGGNEPFEFTINLQRDRNLNLSTQYPKLENVALQLWINNKWEEVMVSNDNLADFKSIPGELRNQTVPIRFATNKYWKLLQDSVTLSGKSQVLTITPDGLLGTVSGKVRSEQDATFLSGVEVEIEGVLDTTDARGNFNIAIPPDKQKSRYIYIAQKKDYQTKTEPFEFDGEPIEIRLRKQ